MFQVSGQKPERCETCGRQLQPDGDQVFWVRLDRGVAIGWCSDACVLETVKGEVIKDFAGNAFAGLVDMARKRRKGGA